MNLWIKYKKLTFSLYKIVVLPAASSPMNIPLTSFLAKNRFILQLYQMQLEKSSVVNEVWLHFCYF